MARGKKTSDSVSAAKEKRAAGVTAKKRAPSAATAATVATSSSSNGKVQKRGKKTVGSAAAAAALAESSGTKATRSGNHRPLGTYGEALLTKAELRAFGKMRGIERMPTPVLLKTCELIVETFDDIQDATAAELMARAPRKKNGEINMRVQAPLVNAAISAKYGQKVYGLDEAFPDAVPLAFRKSAMRRRHLKEKEASKAAIIEAGGDPTEQNL